MTIEQLRAACEAQPFRTVVIHLADGRTVPVRSREFLSAAPSGRTVVVWQPDDTMHIIDLDFIANLTLQPLTKGRPSGKTVVSHSRPVRKRS
jgi:hypothetical protein